MVLWVRRVGIIWCMSVSANAINMIDVDGLGDLGELSPTSVVLPTIIWMNIVQLLLSTSVDANNSSKLRLLSMGESVRGTVVCCSWCLAFPLPHQSPVKSVALWSRLCHCHLISGKTDANDYVTLQLHLCFLVGQQSDTGNLNIGYGTVKLKCVMFIIRHHT